MEVTMGWLTDAFVPPDFQRLPAHPGKSMGVSSNIQPKPGVAAVDAVYQQAYHAELRRLEAQREARKAEQRAVDDAQQAAWRAPSVIGRWGG
jgi:hypothetical protein